MIKNIKKLDVIPEMKISHLGLTKKYWKSASYKILQRRVDFSSFMFGLNIIEGMKSFESSNVYQIPFLNILALSSRSCLLSFFFW